MATVKKDLSYIIEMSGGPTLVFKFTDDGKTDPAYEELKEKVMELNESADINEFRSIIELIKDAKCEIKIELRK